jgi:hypothetical protein
MSDPDPDGSQSPDSQPWFFCLLIVLKLLSSTGMFGLGHAVTKCTKSYSTPPVPLVVKWNPLRTPRLVWVSNKYVPVSCCCTLYLPRTIGTTPPPVPLPLLVTPCLIWVSSKYVISCFGIPITYLILQCIIVLYILY